MVTRLRENVWLLELSGVNAYLVDDGGTMTLVDAGTPLDRRRIEEGLMHVAGAIADVDRILLTHFDIDHVGALHRIEALHAPVYIGRGDRGFLTGDEKPPLGNHKGAFQRALSIFRQPPRMPVHTIDDGDTIGSFTAYSAPGHTPGHTVFVSEDLSVAFLGDLVRESGGEFQALPWLFSYDDEQATDSIVDIAWETPAFAAACPGHGVPFRESGSERLQACADRIKDRRRAVTA